ncbi:MAG TPA: MG2 domain-containing protein, partial [Trueperaceae bacterium]|nr:MG2 domain-containing protein [Trueperaceae bacterium]
AQADPIPGRFATTLDDTDIPGGDSEAIYDITFQRCKAACLEDGDCYAFTFDQRNNVCFLKDVVGEPAAFTGAVSGIITVKDEAALDLAREAAADMPFLQQFDFDTARAQAVGMAERYSSQGFAEADWLELLEPGLGLADAVSATGAAVTIDDSATAWLAHARALAAQAAPERTYDLFRRSVSAAINAALRTPEPARADALLVMAVGLEGSFRGEAALEALRLADRISPGIAPDELARLSEAFGFRVLDHDVESQSATPRVCVAFSEQLAEGIDYAPFVQRSALGLAIEPEGQRLCVTGVAYGQSYTLTMRAGLPSADGETLPRDVPIEVYVRDRAPSVRFPGRAYVLPAQGPRALPVETVNADHLELTLLHVSDRNIVTSIREGSFLQSLGYWDGARFESNLTETVWTGDADLTGELNRTTTSLLPLDAVGALEPGVYVLRAQVAGADTYEVPPALQWFLISDLGVTTLAGSDGLHVVVQRLSDGQPASGMRVELVARSNRALGEAVTDDKGHVLFGAALTSGNGNSAPALVLVETDDDFAVLSLEEPEFDLSDRGVEGRASPGPLDVFLTADRGVYRPGETINLTVLIRDARAQAVEGLPLTVRLVRPDGVEYTRIVDTDDMAGGYVVALPLADTVPRGVWRIETLVDTTAPPLASSTVLVEDFIPERIDVELTLAGEGLVDPGAAPLLVLEAEHLFGAPAAGMSVTGDVTVATVSSLPGWSGYSFGRFDVRTDTQVQPFAADLVTDAQGRLEMDLPLDRLVLDARPYAMTVVATLADGSSRPVERALTRALRPTTPVVGIRPNFAGALSENSEASFDLVIVDPDGTAASGELTWQV